jgi:NDP-sugar pyrophosphorylase family protein
MDLKFKTVENQGKVSVYINYQECNPLSSMLWGYFQAECDMSSIEFTVEKEIPNRKNTMYAIVNKENLIGFFEEVYFFIVDHKSIMDSLNFLEYHNDWTY